jgi:hypothetical protein
MPNVQSAPKYSTEQVACKPQERPREGLQREERQLQEWSAIIDFSDKNPFHDNQKHQQEVQFQSQQFHRILKDKDGLKCLAEREGIVIDTKTQC